MLLSNECSEDSEPEDFRKFTSEVIAYLESQVPGKHPDMPRFITVSCTELNMQLGYHFNIVATIRLRREKTRVVMESYTAWITKECDYPRMNDTDEQKLNCIKELTTFFLRNAKLINPRKS